MYRVYTILTEVNTKLNKKLKLKGFVFELVKWIKIILSLNQLKKPLAVKAKIFLNSNM